MVEVWVNAENGNDANAGSQLEPLKTTKVALGKLSGDNDLVHLDGIFYDGLRFYHAQYPGHVTVDGHNKTLFYGFNGEYKPFDVSNPPTRNYNVVSVNNSHNLTVRNAEVWGGVSSAIGMSDSYPDIGLKNLNFENMRVKYAASRGIFMGGHNIDGIRIHGCDISETLYADTTHGIYLSGGHWGYDDKPVRNVKITNTTCKYNGGRHGIQLNGRFDGVALWGNKLYHNELAGISLIGCRNVEVIENEIYGNNRQGVVIYDYWDDSYFDINDPESVKKWLFAHHPCDRILLRNNTIVVGPTQWGKDAYHNNNPYYHVCVLVNNNIPSLGIPYPQKQIAVVNNVLYSPLASVLKFGHPQEAMATYVHDNLMWTDQEWHKPCIEVPYGDGTYEVEWLQEHCEKWYKGNVVINPQFAQMPEYQFVDRTIDPGFNFGMNHETKADLFSEVAAKMGKGKTYKKHLTSESNSTVPLPTDTAPGRSQ
jgi:hypothetical protein